MKPTIKLATSKTPDGGEMVLYKHDRDFSIKVNGEELMHSRQHESELELARLGCAHIVSRKAPNILIGGLGMGYTLRETLNIIPSEAKVMVGELLEDVVLWNRKFMGELNNNPLEDKRVEVKTGDIVELISNSTDKFDSILLDIDNGPKAMTDSGNNRLYGYQGILACQQALRKNGCLAVWSAEPSKEFEQLLMDCNFHLSRFRVPAYKGSKSPSLFIWVASENKKMIPPGGGEPRQQNKGKSKKKGNQSRKNR